MYAHAASLVCIHNLAHQGAYPANRFAELALPGDVYPTFEWKPPDAPNQKQVNVLKAGLVTADALITVSQGYAYEIVNTPQVQRVDLLLKESGRHLKGIVNGIDTQEWNPATDTHLVANYSADVSWGERVEAGRSTVTARHRTSSGAVGGMAVVGGWLTTPCAGCLQH